VVRVELPTALLHQAGVWWDGLAVPVKALAVRKNRRSALGGCALANFSPEVFMPNPANIFLEASETY